MITTDRYCVDGKFAIIYSPHYSHGWYTTHGIIDLLFSPFICNIIDKYGVDGTLDPTYNSHCEYGLELIEEFIDKSYIQNDDTMSMFIEVGPLKIKWIPVGERFTIIVNKGREVVLTESDITWID